jgi:hypothetical chaperone protein
MSSAVGYGIDYGTSNSSISIAYDDGRVEVLGIGTGDMPDSLPSIAYLHRDGNRLSGEEAVNEYLITGPNRTVCDRCSLVRDDIGGRSSNCRQFEPGGFCSDSRLMYGLKSELANDMFKKTHSWALDFEMRDLVSIVLRDLKKRADAHVDGSVERAVIGMPVAFVGTERGDFDALQALGEDRLVESAYEAGFEEVDLLPEPAAAILDQPLEPGISVALDFGGGTFDAAVIEMPEVGGGAEVIGLQGAAVGGTEFDGLLFDYAVASEIGVDQRIPAAYRRSLRTLMGVRFLLSDKNLRGVLGRARLEGTDTEAIEEILFGGHAYAFYKAIENAKVALSDVERTSIEFRRPGVRVDRPIERAEFESLIEPHIAAVRRAIDNALEEAETSPGDVHTVVRTGGSSKIPKFLDLVGDTFSRAEMRELPVFTAVAQGLGYEAMMRWR